MVNSLNLKEILNKALIAIAFIFIIFAIIQLCSFLFFIIASGNRLMMIGDDWINIHYYLNVLEGKESIFFDVLDRSGQSSNIEALTRFFTLMDIKFGNGTLIFAMFRVIILLLGSSLITSYFIFKIKNINNITKTILIAFSFISFTSFYWIFFAFVPQHNGILYCIFFALLTFFFLAELPEQKTQKQKISFQIIIFLTGFLSLFSWSNGLLIFPIIYFISYKNQIYKIFSKRNNIIFSIFTLAILIHYFGEFGSYSGTDPAFYKQPFNTFYYFLQLLGGAFSYQTNRVLGAIFGLFILIPTTYILYKKIIKETKPLANPQETFLISALIFFIGTIFLIAIGRISWNAKEPPLRYIPILIYGWPILVTLLILEFKKQKIFLIPIILLSLISNFNFFSKAHETNYQSYLNSDEYLINSTLKDHPYYGTNSNFIDAIYDHQLYGVKNNIAFAIGTASKASAPERRDLKNYVTPTIALLKKHQLGPFNWHKKYLLNQKINNFKQTNKACKIQIKKSYYFNDSINPATAISANLITKENSDLILISDNQIITGLALISKNHKSFKDLILGQEREKRKIFGTKRGSLNKNTAFWVLNKKTNSVQNCKISD